MSLLSSIDLHVQTLSNRAKGLIAAPSLEEFGRVESIGDGTALVSGLGDVQLNEIVMFENGARGLAASLESAHIGVILLDSAAGLKAGGRVRKTGEVVQIPTGEQLLGRVVDPLGRPLDDGPPLMKTVRRPIERPAPPIIDRDFITEPLSTGVLAIDALIPLGRGQRELIIGDRGTGKTTLAVDAIINQRRSDVVSIYVAIGQKAVSIRQVIEAVRTHGNIDRCIFVVAPADAPAGLQWIAPYSACTIAEHFRDNGGHSLMVIDDLTKHANIHRQLSLLLRDSPGREAYPSDVFYLHARLLERAAKLASSRGGGSLSALAIAETQAGDISAYIPTNLISITDGQLYLDTHLFSQDRKPAIDIGKSVSRVGGKAQPPAVKRMSGSLKLAYAQFLELESFTRFGHVTDAGVSRELAHGQQIRAMLRQPQWQPLSTAGQIAVLAAIRDRLLDDTRLESLPALRAQLDQKLWSENSALASALETSAVLSASDEDALRAWLKRFISQWRTGGS